MTGAPAAWLLAALPLAALPLAAVQAQTPPDEPMPHSLPGIDRARIAIPHGSLAGHSVVVLEVDSRHAPRTALAEVERHWRAQGADTVLQAQAGEWFVLSRTGAAESANASPRLEGFETLQLRAVPGGGSEGLFTRWRSPREPAPADALARLVPSGARLVRQLSSGGDAERRGTTLVAHFNDSLDATEFRLDRHLQAQGFEPMGTSEARALRWRDDRARFYRGPSAELLVTLHRQPQGASAVLHHVEMPR